MELKRARQKLKAVPHKCVFAAILGDSCDETRIDIEVDTYQHIFKKTYKGEANETV